MAVPIRLDHLVVATPDVGATSSWLAANTGVIPSVGGPHLGRGTHNVLCSLGPGTYLEIIGPDPSQPDPAERRPFGVDDVTEARLATWCFRPADLDDHLRTAQAAGTEYSAPEAMSRRSPDGVLEWRLAFVQSDTAGGIVPFVIDWGISPHPSTTAAPGLHLESLRALHPDPHAMRARLDAIDVDLAVDRGTAPGLRAILGGPTGSVTLEP